MPSIRQRSHLSPGSDFRSHFSTLELSNLAAAVQGLEGRTLRVSLPGQTVSLGTSTLRIRLTTPDHFHLNSLAPSGLTLTSSNPPALALRNDTVSWMTDDPFVEILVPVSTGSGDAILTAQGQVYYCRSGAEAISLVENVDISLPLTVQIGTSPDEVVLEYALPEPPISN